MLPAQQRRITRDAAHRNAFMNMAQRNSTALGAAATVSATVAAACLWWWLAWTPATPLALRVPGADGRPQSADGDGGAVTNLAGVFQAFSGKPGDLPGAWPRFRSSNFDNIVRDGARLADSWDAAGPPQRWKVELGEGHAAPVVLEGRVYVLDYDEKAKADAIRCFSLEDGAEIWRRSYSVQVKRNHGMSRTIPAVTDKYLVTFGPRCHVVCLDPKTGDFRWGIDLQREYGAKEPLWYSGQCPLIDEDAVILAPCGKDVLMMAVDAETGKEVWRTPNTPKWEMSHSSIIPATIGGRRMYIYCAVGGMVGVSAEKEDAGALLWQLPWSARVVAPSPVPIEDGKIFQAAGYGKGGMMIEVKRTGDGAATAEGGTPPTTAGGRPGGFDATVLYEHEPKGGLACEQQTAIYHDGLLYAIMPKDAGALHGQFVCYRTDGQLEWSSGAANRFGLGPFLLADGKFYLLSDDGTLTMVRASRDAFEPLATARVLDGQDAWGPIALAGTRMLVRDSKHMACIDVGAK